MKTKKIISLLLVCVLTLTIFASCEKKRNNEVTPTDTSSDSYVIRTSIDLFCDDEVMGDFFDNLENDRSVIYVDGNKIKAERTYEVEASGKHVRKDTYVISDGVIYDYYRYYMNDILQSSKTAKSNITSDEVSGLLNGFCFIGGISEEGFSEIQEESLEDKDVTTYSEPDAKNRIVFERMVVSLLEGYCDLVTLRNATLTVTETEVGYSDAIALCSFDVTIGGEVYALSATVRLDFDYSESFDVSLPSDSDKYEEVEINDIID